MSRDTVAVLQYSPDNVYKLRWKLDTKDSDRFKSDFPQWILRNGVLFEHRNTKQADLEGYGTVCLRSPRGAGGTGLDQPISG